MHETSKSQNTGKTETSAKKYLLIIWALTGISCCIIIYLCFLIFQFFAGKLTQEIASTQESTNQQASAPNTPVPQAPVSSPPPARQALDGKFPRFNNSTVLQPVAKKLYQHITGEDLPADFEFLTTPEAYKMLFSQDLDFIMATYPSKDEQATAQVHGHHLQLTPIISDAFVFLVSASNPVSNLTQQQIRDIYSGRIANWNQVGGPNAPIEAYQRNTNSGSQTGMIDLVMKDTPLMTPLSHQIPGDMGGLVDIISNYNGQENGIGYSYKYYADTIYRDIDNNVADGVKILSIDGVAPTAANIQAKTYPFTTAYYFVYNANTVTEQTEQVLNFLQSSSGKKMIEDLQYVPYN